MTTFNPDNLEELSYGQALGPAMQITEQADADQYLRDYMRFIASSALREGRPLPTPEECLKVAKHNLGYYAQYFDKDLRKRMVDLFGAVDPVQQEAQIS